MTLRPCTAGLMLGLLAACGTVQPPPDFKAQHRPLEERCVRTQKTTPSSKPGLTQAESRAEAQAAARRGELDPACNAL